MTQPAKVQEPSMEEILASIRRIIADDEAKPSENKPSENKPSEKRTTAAASASSEAPAAAPPAPKPAVMTDIPPSAIVAAPPPTAKAAPAAATNRQEDIDAMLAGLDAATSEAEVRPPLPDGDVFELTDEMALPAEQSVSFRKVEPEDDLEFSEAVAASAPRRQPAYEPPPLYESPAPAPPPQQILSRSTVSAVESAFNTLANTVLSNNARTLEDLVKEMLRPMLKSWLDDNLPGLVERIVKAEIERVSRGR
jgi:cell pole-organizing protein PopZ